MASPGPWASPGQRCATLCIHHAYALLYFLGRPTSVVAAASHMHFSDPDADDQVMLVLKMPDGAIANLWGSLVADDRTSAPWTVFYKLLGTEGAASPTHMTMSIAARRHYPVGTSLLTATASATCMSTLPHAAWRQATLRCLHWRMRATPCALIEAGRAGVGRGYGNRLQLARISRHCGRACGWS